MPGEVEKTSTQKQKKHIKRNQNEKKDAPPAKVVEKQLDSESDFDSEEDGEDGVNEEGLAKLMRALGNDGVGDFERMQLEELNDEEDDDGSDEESASEQIAEQDSSESEEERTTQDGRLKIGRSEQGQSSSEANEEEEAAVGDGEEEETEESGVREEVALDDAESVDEDVVARPKVVINNTTALERIRDTIALHPKLPWTETLVVTYPETIQVDVEDDLNRELAFYKQALYGATTARKLADQHKLPSTRPSDYFAEMVKSDAHMERVRQRLLDEKAAIKKGEDKRKEREGKKFGKQVQIEKQKERERSKKEMEERLKGLKRKRIDMLDDSRGDGEGGDDFDIAVEDAVSDRPNKRAKGGAPKISRKGRDTKFGFGGKDRRSKQNTRESTEIFETGGRKGAGGRLSKGARGAKPQRPGKSKRHATKRR